MKRLLIAIALSSLSIGAQAVELNLGSLKDKAEEVAVVHKECAPDVRVDDLNGVIDQIKAGTLEKNIQFTPEDFIVLKQKFVDLLKSRYEVVQDDCEVVKLIGGEFSKPIRISFATLWNEILRSATAKDNARVDYLISNFTAKPMAANAAVFNLLVPANIPLDILDSLASKLGVAQLKSERHIIHHKLANLTIHDESLDVQYTKENYVLLLDIFSRLGGKLTGELPQTITNGNVRSQYELYKVIKDNNSQAPAIKTLGLLGYDAVPMFK